MAHIKNKDIHKDARFAGCLLRKIMPVFTKEQPVKLSVKCERFLTGRWLGKHTTIKTRFLDRPDSTKLLILSCRSKDGVKPNVTGLLWIHGCGMVPHCKNEKRKAQTAGTPLRKGVPAAVICLGTGTHADQQYRTLDIPLIQFRS